MKVDHVLDKRLIGNAGKTATEIRLGKEKTLYHCVRVFPTKQEMEKAEDRMALFMFDDQDYKIIRGTNGYGFFVEVLYLTKDRIPGYMMEDPYAKRHYYGRKSK